jgi:hypothetical protein
MGEAGSLVDWKLSSSTWMARIGRESIEHQLPRLQLLQLGGLAFVSGEARSPDGSPAYGNSIANYGSNVLHLLLAETVKPTDNLLWT